MFPDIRSITKGQGTLTIVKDFIAEGAYPEMVSKQKSDLSRISLSGTPFISKVK